MDAKYLHLPLSRSDKISVKNSCISIIIRITIEMQSAVDSHKYPLLQEEIDPKLSTSS